MIFFAVRQCYFFVFVRFSKTIFGSTGWGYVDVSWLNARLF